MPGFGCQGGMKGLQAVVRASLPVFRLFKQNLPLAHYFQLVKLLTAQV